MHDTAKDAEKIGAKLGEGASAMTCSVSTASSPPLTVQDLRRVIDQIPSHPIETAMLAKGFDPAVDWVVVHESVRGAMNEYLHRAIRFSPCIDPGSVFFLRASLVGCSGVQLHG